MPNSSMRKPRSDIIVVNEELHFGLELMLFQQIHHDTNMLQVCFPDSVVNQNVVQVYKTNVPSQGLKMSLGLFWICMDAKFINENTKIFNIFLIKEERLHFGFRAYVVSTNP